ncbi:MAG: prepilin peptidase [SAR324 cluster bacterium]|uniref:Prepilin peptidase n=1 Tax=SAR324 cluster bacterium TaxID=2024889 RepID=A0A7X9IMK9_9DELT|nr:prepilin peptidase [SAR324 cluster bacterium]
METILNLLILVIGLLIGSFLNVCIYRMPLSRLDRWYSPDEGEEAQSILAKLRKDLSITKPARSFCPSCQHQLRWFENIPVVSWLLLGGKCSSCKTSISIRYPVVELLTGNLALLSVMKFGFSATALVVFGTLCVFIIITFIDYDYYVIPDELSIRGSIIAIMIALISQFYGIFSPPVVAINPEFPIPPILDSVLGMLAGAGFLLLIYFAYLFLRKREGLGLGDIKLLLFIGALFGIQAALYTIFIGSLLGSILGLGLILIGGRKLSSAIPFGPYLTVSATLYIFTGFALPNAILNIFA